MNKGQRVALRSVAPGTGAAYPLAVLTSALMLAGGAAHVAGAAEYPVKPIRIVVGFAPGGGTDTTTRALAPKLSAALGQQIVVDNRPGAAGNIGTDLVAKAPADGYTLLMGTIAALAINPSLYDKLPFDPVRDFAPISRGVDSTNVLVVHPSVPVKTVKELIALAKKRPGDLNYGSSGVGGAGHLAGELFNLMADTKLVHVPYKGGAPAMIDLIAGHVHMIFATATTANPQIKAGKIRPLAVTTLKRAVSLPDVPTIAEAGIKGFEANNWYGLLAPAKTPRPIIDRMNREFVAALRMADVKEFLLAQGLEPAPSTPEEFADYIKSEMAKWAKVVKASGAKVN